MRRSTAISQLLLLLTFYGVPLFASSDVALPACCRRNGAHHCAMMSAVANGHTTFHDPLHCPYRFPISILTHTTELFLPAAWLGTHNLVPRQLAVANNAGSIVVQSAPAFENRGPPALTL